MWDWITQNESLLFWLGVGSVASLVLIALLLPVMIVRLPADYFVRPHHVGHGRRSWLDWLWHIGKNVLGGIFVLAGIAMLVLPGQGVLTILIGTLLMDFPRKKRFERWLVTRPGVLKVVNRMRQKRGHEPLLT